MVITPRKCKELAAEYRTLSQQVGTSADRAFLMKDVARTLIGLAGQLDRLTVLTRHEKQRSDGTWSHRPKPPITSCQRLFATFFLVAF